MRSNPFLAVLILSMPAWQVAGCGGGTGRQVIVKERRVAPVHVDTRDGVRVRAPFADLRVPRRDEMKAGHVDVPIIDPD